jgi:hypothetical protein
MGGIRNNQSLNNFKRERKFELQCLKLVQMKPVRGPVLGEEQMPFKTVPMDAEVGIH